jgi:hypothetical protein
MRIALCEGQVALTGDGAICPSVFLRSQSRDLIVDLVHRRFRSAARQAVRNG